MKNMNLVRVLIFILMLAAIQHACSTQNQPEVDGSAVQHQRTMPKILADQREMEMESLILALKNKRVVFVGESHDRYDHHLNQLAIVQRLYETDPLLAIGLEMFQQPFQPYLDAFIAGQIDERELLAKTEYFERWGFDYRLYRPILDYARERGIPLIALNVPREISRKVGRVGLGGLTAEERAWVPDHIDKSDLAYRDRLKKVFEAHQMPSGNFEHFLEVQLLWDEGMAARAAQYLKEHPDQRLVVLAGSGHLAYGAGIPQRLQRRIPVEGAIVLQVEEAPVANLGDNQIADYLLISSATALPPTGRLGVMLETASTGMRVQRVVPDSAAQKAGILPDDRIVGIESRPIQTMQDIQLSLLDKSPGELVKVMVERENRAGSGQELALDVVLQQ